MKEVNKYKLICVVLAIALLASMTRLIVLINNTNEDSQISRADVVMSNILQRKSVRSFTNQPIEKSKLDTLLRAAMAAPTGKDMRPWKFVVVNDKQAMKSLCQNACLGPSSHCCLWRYECGRQRWKALN